MTTVSLVEEFWLTRPHDLLGGEMPSYDPGDPVLCRSGTTTSNREGKWYTSRVANSHWQSGFLVFQLEGSPGHRNLRNLVPNAPPTSGDAVGVGSLVLAKMPGSGDDFFEAIIESMSEGPRGLMEKLRGKGSGSIGYTVRFKDGTTRTTSLEGLRVRSVLEDLRRLGLRFDMLRERGQDLENEVLRRLETYDEDCENVEPTLYTALDILRWQVSENAGPSKRPDSEESAGCNVVPQPLSRSLSRTLGDVLGSTEFIRRFTALHISNLVQYLSHEGEEVQKIATSLVMFMFNDVACRQLFVEPLAEKLSKRDPGAITFLNTYRPKLLLPAYRVPKFAIGAKVIAKWDPNSDDYYEGFIVGNECVGGKFQIAFFDGDFRLTSSDEIVEDIVPDFSVLKVGDIVLCRSPTHADGAFFYGNIETLPPAASEEVPPMERQLAVKFHAGRRKGQTMAVKADAIRWIPQTERQDSMEGVDEETLNLIRQHEGWFQEDDAARAATLLSRQGGSAKKEESPEKRSPIPASEEFRYLLGNEEFSDVKFLLDSGTFIPAHRILCARNSWMKSLLASGMKESQEGVIAMPGTGEGPLRMLLEYLYCGALQPPKDGDEVDLWNLLSLSRRLLEPGLEAFAAEVLATGITMETFGLMFKNAQEINCPKLMQRCLDFICSSTANLTLAFEDSYFEKELWTSEFVAKLLLVDE